MKNYRICTYLILTALIALLCCGTAGAGGTDNLPRVTVTTWPQMKTALESHPDGVIITLGSTIVAGYSDNGFYISDGQNVIIDLNGKTLNRNTHSATQTSETRAFVVLSGGNLTIRDSVGGGRITGQV